MKHRTKSIIGKEYLDKIITQERAEEMASTSLSWDLEADEMIKFVKDNA